jgi:hypothetical protein
VSNGLSASRNIAQQLFSQKLHKVESVFLVLIHTHTCETILASTARAKPKRKGEFDSKESTHTL